MGPKNLVIKKGEHGALLFSKNEVFYAPALPLEKVFDPVKVLDPIIQEYQGVLDNLVDDLYQEERISSKFENFL